MRSAPAACATSSSMRRPTSNSVDGPLSSPAARAARSASSLDWFLSMAQDYRLLLLLTILTWTGSE